MKLLIIIITIYILRRHIMKTFVRSIAPACLMLLLILNGCGSSSSNEFEEGKVNVVASFYPLFDFAQQIGGEHVNVIQLVPVGVDPHDWSPKTRDMVSIEEAQMFVYNGFGFEGWVDRFLETMGSDKVVVEAVKGIEPIAL